APAIAIAVPVCAAPPVTPSVTVVEPLPGTETRMLDGASYGGAPVGAEGPHTIAVSATDAAGNSASASRTFTIDATPPQITVSGVADGAAYGAAVAPTVSFSDANLVTTSLLLNGSPFVSGT